MNSLERAKRFFGQKTSKLAMLAVPLAAAALIVAPASAGTVFSTGGCGTSSGTGGVCSDVQANSVGGDPQANWIQIWSTATTPDPTTHNVTQGNNSGTFSGSGFVNGESIPVAWDFLTAGTGTFNWTANFSVFTLGLGSGSLSPSGSGNAGDEIRGNGIITMVGATSTTGSYTIQLSVTGAGLTSLTIPAGVTLDLNSPFVSSTVPEPSTGLLGGLGIAAAALLRRLRRNVR